MESSGASDAGAPPGELASSPSALHPSDDRAALLQALLAQQDGPAGDDVDAAAAAAAAAAATAQQPPPQDGYVLVLLSTLRDNADALAECEDDLAAARRQRCVHARALPRCASTRHP